MSEAVDFLTRVLPGFGHYCLHAQTAAGRRVTEFFPTIDALAARQEAWDASGATVYHACASFVEPRADPKGTKSRDKRLGRTQHNVAWLRSLWLDLDAGPAEAGKDPKPYPDARAAASAVLAFCQATQLPPPLLVASGHGIHCYWPLSSQLTLSEWKILASGLKQLCVLNNLHADGAKTADASCVLRTPGTHNRKHGQERLVRAFQLVGPYSLKHFQFLRGDPENNKLMVPEHLRARPQRDLLSKAIVNDHSPAPSAEHIADYCAQLATMRHTKGVMPEPAWYAALGVLAYCADGAAKAQEWSSGYDGYSEAETAEKLAQAHAGADGPSLCARFHALSAASRATCEACPLWGKIKSPISAARGVVEISSPPPNQVNGHASLALFDPRPETAARRLIRFPDLTEEGKPRATCANTATAIAGLGIDCRQDIFHERLLVGGHPIAQWAGDLSDAAVLMLRKIIWRAFSFDPGERHARDAAMQLCLEHQFNPVTDYLASLHWDGAARIDAWTHTYLGAADTALNRAFGRLMLIAAARRARAPGTKFDQIVVLEGPQGVGKSSAIRILAGEENFSDQHILAASDREQQEAFRGVWLHEIAELAGMRRTDVERIKQFARRTEDRARPAYGRIRQDMKRRGIFVATTNEEEYLKEYDRAFWPIAVGQIDLAGLARDRDQLWAEAAHYEAAGEPIELAQELRLTAADHQSERHEEDPWLNLVSRAVKNVAEISITDVLTGGIFLMKAGEITQAAQNRVARILKKLGFRRKRAAWEGNKRPWIYAKWDSGA